MSVGYRWQSPTYIDKANPIWRRLLRHDAARACALALHNAGNNNPARMPVMPMTTISSTKVKAFSSCLIDIFLGEPARGRGMIIFRAGGVERFKVHPLFADSYFLRLANSFHSVITENVATRRFKDAS